MRQIKDFFNFNRIERRGVVVLLMLLVFLLLLNLMLPYFFKANDIDFSAFEKEVMEFEVNQKRISDSINSSRSYQKTDISRLQPFPFDPNNLPENKWKEMGLTDRQIKIIKNYEAKGGHFYNKNDLKKIYGISTEEFEVLKPYIRIEQQFDEKQESKPEVVEIHPFPFDPNELDEEEWLSMGLREKLVKTILKYREKGGKFYESEDLKNIYGMRENEFIALETFIHIKKDTVRIFEKKINANDLMLDINAADTLDLQQLKGIGPSYARRIVKYRERLGGFSSIEQLYEVYGMDSLRFEGIAKNIIVETDSIQRININEAGIKQLIKHPYIEFYLAKSIVTYRKEIGNYDDTEQLKNANLIYEELYEKIKPYICLK
jgi:competence ComEA-like helix-hairpin-helix protein